MSLKTFDLLILGSGPGGFAAALRASQWGIQNIAVLEKREPGGVCVNWGCIPSKSLIHQAKIFESRKTLERMGVGVDLSAFDYGAVHKQSRTVAKKLSRSVQVLLKQNKISQICGDFHFSAPHELTSSAGESFSAPNIILATGSRPRPLPGIVFDEDKVLSSTGALALQTLPEKALIVGSGAIGLEFAFIWNAFGVAVHVVELLDQVLPSEDQETGGIFEKILKKKGVRFSTKTQFLDLQQVSEGKTLDFCLRGSDGVEKREQADKILLALGRIPNTETLHLEKAGFKEIKGTISVDDHYQTEVPGVFAIGDLCDSPMLAHVASREGEIVAEYIFGKSSSPKAHRKKIDPLLVPACVYGDPEVASFGLTELKAEEAGLPVRVLRYPYRGSGKALCIEKPEGQIKIVVHEKTDKILGAQIVGTDATELIHELLLASATGQTLSSLSQLIHAHPTLSELFQGGG